MLVVKIGRVANEKRAKKIEDAVKEFVKLKAAAKVIADKLKVQQVILADFGKIELENNDAATITLRVDDDAVNMKYDWAVTIKDDKKLRAELGDRYQDLVSIKTTVAPLAKLKDMALQEDGDELKLCLDVKEKAVAFKVV